MLALFDVQPEDIFIIASNSGVNGSILGVALAAKQRGHKLIAVTSLDHTSRVTPKHPSGKRLSEVADIVIDNLAPYGDSTMELEGGVGVGAVSSITAAFIAQRITIGVAEAMRQRGKNAPRSTFRPIFRAATSTTVLSKISMASGSAGKRKHLAGTLGVE